jgi:Flp pilus assembly protein TadD
MYRLASLLLGAMVAASVLPFPSAAADDLESCIKGTGDTRISACTKIIERLPKAGFAYNNRGNEWLKKGEYDRAIADYDQAIRIQPKSASALNGRGVARREKGEFDRALVDHDEAIRLSPKRAEYYNNRGIALREKGELDRATADYDQAIELDPKYANPLNNRGVVWKLKGDLERALTDYSEAIRLNPNYALAYNNRGDAWAAKGDLQRALADLSEAVRINPRFITALADRGSVYEKLGNVAAARADFNAALALSAKGIIAKHAQERARTRLAALSASPPAAATRPVTQPAVAAAPPTPAALPAASPRTQTATAPLPAPLPAPRDASGRRVALVIGNSNYSDLRKIPNPQNDAEDLAAALKGVGFEVLTGIDLKRNAMEDIFIRFARMARQSETALVFYAGHGLQYQGINYLTPVDSKVEDVTDLRKLISLQDVIGDLQGASRVRILIVDACRDNEAIAQLASRLPASRSAALNRGLARIEGADGTLIAFATQPNRVAADGAGRNSPFTQALLKHLPTPGLELRTLMARVRADVVDLTGGGQRPEVWDSLVGEFAFNTGR